VVKARTGFVSTRQPITPGICPDVRAEATDEGQAVEATQPLVTVAANLGQLALVSLPESELVSLPESTAAATSS
jgi:hypothetical protein